MLLERQLNRSPHILAQAIQDTQKQPAARAELQLDLVDHAVEAVSAPILPAGGTWKKALVAGFP